MPVTLPTKGETLKPRNVNSIYPPSEFLRWSAIFTSHIGMFPSELLFSGNKLHQSVYELYSKIVVVYYIYITISMFVALGYLLLENPVRMSEVFKNSTTTILCATAIGRQFAMRVHPAFLKILRFIVDSEQDLMCTDDKKVLKLYFSYKNKATFNSLFYLTMTYSLTLFYLLRPFVMDSNQVLNGNDTITELRSFPMSIWVPFDDQTYYWLAYAWNCINTLVMTSIVSSVDVLTLLLIIYPVSQLQILNHILGNFEAYMGRIQALHNIQDSLVVGEMTFQACIAAYRNIIDYVDNLNACISVFMVLDFAQSSVLFATVIAQLLWNPPSFQFYGFVLLYLLYLNQRIFVLYYYSNEIWILSENLSLFFWRCKWYDLSMKVKRMMTLFILRTRRPLRINIGPFGVMSLSTYIAILKATYSYMTLLSSVKE
ncbi:odorant receptor 10-like [Euwallacea fornicatus]|uniref:odorant receptor 10-like n=1 Tax=Euwallacea fornicatus TaxID=995702 RepID=UPI0033900CFC